MRWIIAWLMASTISFTAFAEEQKGEASEKAVPEPIHVTTTGSVKINGKRIDYDVVAGQLLMKDDEGKPIALFGYTAYTQQDADRRERPVCVCLQRRPRLSVYVAAHGDPRPAAHRSHGHPVQHHGAI
jgi:hypothetical protein